jgi:hypothetical protein
MSPAMARTACIALCCVCSSPAFAQYEVEQDQRVWLRALLDVRLVHAGPATSWTDGGAGKTRYGGRSTDTGFERATRLELSQLDIEAGAALPWDVRAQAQINIQRDVADGYEPWLIEAILRREWGDANQGFGLQTGVMNLPFSLEHVGPAWSPDFTLSASALNSWLWEDVSLAGAEGEWWRVTKSGFRLGALVGTGYGPDQLGRLLALRGWALGDGLSGFNGDLALPARFNDRTEIFDERDHRPAAYAWLTLGDAEEIASLKVGYFDNNGDENTAGVWHTRFSTVGATVHPHPRIDLLVQYLNGTAHVRQPANDSSVRAFYSLVSYHYKRQRVSVRYDSFAVHDLDGGPISTRERGDGVTADYMIQLGLRHRIALEHIWLNSRRPASAFPDPSPDGWQLSYRFRY